jgi:plasmid stabilization system protein ParE
MNYTLIIRPEAEDDIDQAFRWYELQSIGLGTRFLGAVEEGLKQLQDHPTSYQVIHEPVRRLLLKRFPYALLYTIVEGRLIVIACFHAKQSPEIWKSRLE